MKVDLFNRLLDTVGHEDNIVIALKLALDELAKDYRLIPKDISDAAVAVGCKQMWAPDIIINDPGLYRQMMSGTLEKVIDHIKEDL